MSTADSLSERLGNSDVGLILGVVGGLYLLFIIFGVILGLDIGGIASTLQRLTFLAAVYALLALALNLQWGYAGLFNIGVAGFMAVGAYTMAMLTAPVDPGVGGIPGLGLPLWAGVIGGMVAAALVGGITALPALRLRADYLAIVTLALSEIIRLLYNSTTFQSFSIGGRELGTGGASGIPGPINPVRDLYYTDPASPQPPPTAFGEAMFGFFGGFGIDGPIVVDWTYTLVLVVFVGLFYFLLTRVGNSPFGRVLKAIREDEIVASSLGKNTRWFKIKVFMLGCALMPRRHPLAGQPGVDHARPLSPDRHLLRVHRADGRRVGVEHRERGRWRAVRRSALPRPDVRGPDRRQLVHSRERPEHVHRRDRCAWIARCHAADRVRARQY